MFWYGAPSGGFSLPHVARHPTRLNAKAVRSRDACRGKVEVYVLGSVIHCKCCVICAPLKTLRSTPCSSVTALLHWPAAKCGRVGGWD